MDGIHNTFKSQELIAGEYDMMIQFRISHLTRGIDTIFSAQALPPHENWLNASSTEYCSES